MERTGTGAAAAAGHSDAAVAAAAEEEEEEAVTRHTRSYAARDRRLTKGRSRWTERAAKKSPRFRKARNARSACPKRD